MRKDQDIKNDILDELEWDPEVDMSDISITVVDGAVTLRGTVASYAERRAAERAVRRVRGVVTIAQDLRVALANEEVADDSELAKRIAHVLEWDPALPHKDIRAEVRNGDVTLSGVVAWHFQREVIENHIARMRGVRSIDNGITVLHRPSPRDVRREIVRALHRNADIEASHIAIEVKDGVVHLGGSVRAFYEKDLVKNAVLMAPGVVAVRDELGIS
jgi:osmotically-inducible protein OsmY